MHTRELEEYRPRRVGHAVQCLRFSYFRIEQSQSAISLGIADTKTGCLRQPALNLEVGIVHEAVARSVRFFRITPRLFCRTSGKSGTKIRRKYMSADWKGRDHDRGKAPN